MSQASDVLQKILQLEEHKGFLDSAVGGGLGAYADRWATQARVRMPAAEPLIGAIRDILAPYGELSRPGREVRLRRALDLLERLATGETAAPDGEEVAEAKPRNRRRAAAPAPLSMAVGATVRTNAAPIGAPAAPPAPAPDPAPRPVYNPKSKTQNPKSLDEPVTAL